MRLDRTLPPEPHIGRDVFRTVFEDDDGKECTLLMTCFWREEWDFYTGWTKFVERYDYKVFNAPHMHEDTINEIVQLNIRFNLGGSVVFEVFKPN